MKLRIQTIALDLYLEGAWFESRTENLLYLSVVFPVPPINIRIVALLRHDRFLQNPFQIH
jgi:hypothetical protein